MHLLVWISLLYHADSLERTQGPSMKLDNKLAQAIW